MLPKILKPSLCLMFLATQVSADPIQILDDKTLSCVKRALRAVDMPQGRSDNPQYGEIRNLSSITGNYLAAISVVTAKDQGLDNHTEHRFIASILSQGEGGYYFYNQRSISISLTKAWHLTKITEEGFSSGWNVSGYGMPHITFTTPAYTNSQLSIMEEWLEKATQSMAFFGLNCLTDDVYTSPNGEDIKPPDFIKLAGLMPK